jgi:hypothetical protein
MRSIIVAILAGCAQSEEPSFELVEDESGYLADEGEAYVADPKAETPCPAGTTTGSWTPLTVVAGSTYTVTVPGVKPGSTGSNYWQYINNSTVSSVGSVNFYICSSNAYSSGGCSSSSPSDTVTYNYKQHLFSTTSAKPYPVGRLVTSKSGIAYFRACYK